MLDYLYETDRESRALQERFIQAHGAKVVDAAQRLSRALRQGNKVMLCGNGGSAADAQHLAAEMVGKMIVDRGPLAAIALTTDTSNLTAIGNDFGFDAVFERQVKAIGRSGDILIAISTSGKSTNILKAVQAAKALGIQTIALTGGDGGALAQQVDLALVVEGGRNSSRIQETHIFIGHSLVDLVDRFAPAT